MALLGHVRGYGDATPLFSWLEQWDPRYVLAFALARFKRLARKTADERDEVSGETFRRLPVRGMTNARVSGEA